MASLSLAFDILARDKASQTFKNVGDSADKAGGKVGGLGGKFGALSGKAKVALAGTGAALVAFGKSSVSAFVEAEEAQAGLEQAFKKFPALAGGNISALRDLNSELAKKTKFDDDATASGQSVLATFGLTADQIAKVTPLLQDYAARTGKDLPTAAKDLGKAVLGQGKALKGIGLNLKDTGSAAGNFESLMGGLNDKVGGFAKNQGKTAAGQAEILKNQFGELQETVGAKLVPVLQSFLAKLFAFGGWLADHKPVLIAVAGIVGTGLVLAFTAWAVSAYAATTALFATGGALAFLMSPVTLIVVAVAALAAGVIYAYTHFEGFRNVVDRVADFFQNVLWPVLQNVAGWITGSLIPTIGDVISKFGEWITKAGEVASGIVEKIGEVVTFVTGLPGTISSAVSGMWDSLKNGLANAVRWILNKIDTLLGPIDELLGKLGGIKGFVQGGDPGGIIAKAKAAADGKRAAGGPVTPGTWLVGEKGPELLTVGGNGYVTPNHALGGGPVTINVTQYDGEDAGAAVSRTLAHHQRIQLLVASR